MGWKKLVSPPWFYPHRMDEDPLRWWRFGILREMHEMRKSRLQLCVDVWGGVGEYAV